MARTFRKNPVLSVTFQLSLVTAALLSGFSANADAQEKTLRIAMTAADIPRTLGQPDQGFEGNRFTGIPIYDSLTCLLYTSDAADE